MNTVEIDLKILQEKGLTPDEYVYLRLTFSKELEHINGVIFDHTSVLDSLCRKGYMKQESDGYYLSDRSFDLFSRSERWFDEFWSLWKGQKIAKEKCKSFYKRYVISATMHQEVIEGLKSQETWRGQCKLSGQFVPEWPYPYTWLNQQRWKDEVYEQVAESGQIAEERTEAHVSGRKIL